MDLQTDFEALYWQKVKSNYNTQYSEGAQAHVFEKRADHQYADLETKAAWIGYYMAFESMKDTLNENLALTNMLVLCGEEECRGVKDLPAKLRALIDGLIHHKKRARSYIEMSLKANGNLVIYKGEIKCQLES